MRPARHSGPGFVDAHRTRARVTDGNTDLAPSVATHIPTGQRVSSLTSCTTTNGVWHSTFSQTNVLSAGSVRFPRNLDLQIGQGRVADDLRSLEPLETIQLDVITEGQLAMHMPVPTSVPSRT